MYGCKSLSAADESLKKREISFTHCSVPLSNLSAFGRTYSKMRPLSGSTERSAVHVLYVGNWLQQPKSHWTVSTWGCVKLSPMFRPSLVIVTCIGTASPLIQVSSSPIVILPPIHPRLAEQSLSRYRYPRYKLDSPDTFMMNRFNMEYRSCRTAD